MPRAGATFWIGVAMMLLVALPGCRGCRQDPLVKRKKELEEKTKKKEEPKEDFEVSEAETVPSDVTSVGPLVKPAHWVTVTHKMKANNFNFQGELRTASTDNRGRPYDVENTQFQLAASRPAPLPKGQTKVFETTYFIPRTAAHEGTRLWLHRELRAARGGRLVKEDRQPTRSMPGYQYCFLVLAGDPDRYGYLKRLTSIASPNGADYQTETLLYYRVTLPTIERIAPLPSHMLTWTSIAYVLWDDLDPNVLTPDQEQALVDWLHWGGQLIISGPNSLEKLRGGFLDPYLPAVTAETIEIDQAAIDEISQHWSLASAKTGQPRTLDVLPGKPLVGVRLQKRPEGEFLPGCGQLLAERRVGGGRVVVTAFSLADRALVNWQSFDSFFNACLLRRPRRQFQAESFLAKAYWADHDPALATDPRVVTTLRLFSRDMGHFLAGSQQRQRVLEPGEEREEPESPADTQGRFSPPVERAAPPPLEAHDPADEGWHFSGYPLRVKYGMAAWNDRSGAADAARQSLKDAAGISIPKGGFVLQVLAVYLIVLAPLNWGLFRMIGRVEWAWIAAPVIAVVGALAVVRIAQLDIGFARSVTEIGIAEAHGGYPRAHLTRYTAMYTSLSTGYEIVFDEESSVAQPFGSATDYVRSPQDAVYTVLLRRDRQLRLSGFKVPSNKTGIVHGEQMVEMGGAMTLAGDETNRFQINNETDVSLEGVGVLRKRGDGQLETAWVGELRAKSSAPLRWAEAPGGKPHLAPWDDSFTTLSLAAQSGEIRRQLDTNNNGRIERDEAARDGQIAQQFDRLDANRDGNWNEEELRHWCRRSRAGEVCLGELIELASRGLHLARGEVRLIGWTGEDLPGMTIRPAAAQTVRRTVFLVHLKRGDLPVPKPDRNCKADVVEEEQDEDEADARGREPTEDGE